MFYVRAVTSGPWRAVDITEARTGDKIGERVLVQALEEGRWNIDNQSVEVVPGLVVSFFQFADAEWFLSQGRAQWITAEPGMVFAFNSEDDANFYVRKRLGEAMSDKEAEAYWAEVRRLMQAAQNPGDDGDDPDGADHSGGDTMLKTKDIENKTVKAPETKSPKPAAKSSKAAKKK